MKRYILAGLVVVGALAAQAAAATQADFDTLVLGAESHWNGDPGVSMPRGFEARYSTLFGMATFNTYYTVDVFSGWPFWGGWAYSNETDTTTPGYGNQFSAITGGAHSGTNYAVAYPDTWYGVMPTVTLDAPMALGSVCLTNTTYAYLAMHDGDGIAKKFGGESGDDKDWFLLTITGKDAGGSVTGTAEFYLADFRFEDSAQDYIVDTWEKVDLASLGTVKSLEFALDSSDAGDWGINTPTYFAMDTLVPEPTVIGLLAIGAGAVLLRRRRR
ncbi:MAG TPA: DUF4465 domain-containing protein [Phycisphaerae bacterium]|nr:DUF4465 domain-containing protein [Phycisphaerae bacterium]